MPKQVKRPDSRAMASGSHGILARAYFRIKPYIPKSLRLAMRRSRVPGILKQSADRWPINPAACGTPKGWKGWPDGKKFALVFTHDIESAAGLANVRHLAELEKRYGFRSSFNFIPEGPYEDPVELRAWLEENGFEIGVHDLNHDGQLYESRESFSRKAKTINEYLAKWKAVGFRSGFMLHQLDWLHELDITYDASTFDTDPFEPQPDGSDTIFPFLVRPPAGGKGPGYIELSYTLPQDSTLFILLQEKSPAIWKRKLEWIKKHGGLALVNIHPDYIGFSNDGFSANHYPASVLDEFLDHLIREHEGTFWNPLARDLAQWYRDGIVTDTKSGRSQITPDQQR
jgi:peptidoglycan/xylan/chitin deacetylase (PgdA/CDA1 family)